MTDKTIASVILENNIDKSLDYLIPTHMISEIKEGMLVEVPLRGRLKKGYVISLKSHTDIKKILNINRIVLKDVISKDIFKLAFWMSKYYCTNLSKIFKFIIPSSIRKEIVPKYNIYISSNKTKKELVNILQDLLISKKSLKQAKAI